MAAYGKNSDACLLLYLGCARAGLVHVPVNFNAHGDELVYLLTQSAPRAAFVDPALGSTRRARPRRRRGRWVGLANHPRLAEADLDELRKAFYGASIMPVPVLHTLQARLPNAGFVDELPKNASGKLLKRELRDQLSAAAAAPPS